jgi:hypothetical protein
LTRCEAGGIQPENCPPYVREWIKREGDIRHSGRG